MLQIKPIRCCWEGCAKTRTPTNVPGDSAKSKADGTRLGKWDTHEFGAEVSGHPGCPRCEDGMGACSTKNQDTQVLCHWENFLAICRVFPTILREIFLKVEILGVLDSPSWIPGVLDFPWILLCSSEVMGKKPGHPRFLRLERGRRQRPGCQMGRDGVPKRGDLALWAV